ncbi:MAG: hypothetical protein ABEJ61_02800 [Haloferacaceae archaeon]
MTTRDRVVEDLRAAGGGEPTDAAGRSSDGGEGRTRVVLLVADAPAGVRRFAVTVGAPDGTRVAAVAPGDLRDRFEVVEGGAGADGVTARSVDFVGAGREPPVVLFGVRFDDPVEPDAVDVSADRLVDHGEGDVAPDRLAVESASSERL